MEIAVTYGYEGRFLTSFRDAENYEYRYTYTYTYDNNGNLSSVENPDFSSRSYRYEEIDGKFKVAEEWDEMNYSQSFFYTETHTTHRNRRGFDTVYEITPSKHISQVTYSDGRVIKEEFNSDGHKSAHINSAGYRHSFYPNSEGNVTRETTVYGGEVLREYHPLFDLPVKEEIPGNSMKNSVVISYMDQVTESAVLSLLCSQTLKQVSWMQTLNSFLPTTLRAGSQRKQTWQERKQPMFTGISFPFPAQQ